MLTALLVEIQLLQYSPDATSVVPVETGDVAEAEEEEDDGIPKPSPNADTTILFVRPDTTAAPGAMGTFSDFTDTLNVARSRSIQKMYTL